MSSVLSVMSPWATIPAAMGAVLTGYLIANERTGTVLLFAAVLLGIWVVLAGSAKLLATLGVVAVMVGPGQLPVVATVADAEVGLNQLVLLGVVAGALIRSRRRRLPWPLVASLALLVVGWGILRTGPGSDVVSFVAVICPLALAIALPRLLGSAEQMWSLLRRVAVALLLLAGWTNGFRFEQTRWEGIIGGSGEIGLVSACLVLLVLRSKSRWRFAQVALGVVGLVGARSVAATLGLAAGLVVLQVAAGGRKRRNDNLSFAPLAVAFAVPCLVLAVTVLRPDLGLTTKIHSNQARATGVVMSKVDPVLGGGWGRSAELTAQYEPGLPYEGLHNTFLQWYADLGMLGFVSLILWLAVMARKAEPTSRALVVLTAIWLNTTGAFPSPAWGVLGLTTAAAVFARMKPTTSPPPSHRRRAPLPVAGQAR